MKMIQTDQALKTVIPYSQAVDATEPFTYPVRSLLFQKP